MTTQQVHGHEIIGMVDAHPEGISTEDLTRMAAEKFGADVRFFTCSAEDMDLPSLLAFLGERDKIQLREGLIIPGGSPACNHDHH